MADVFQPKKKALSKNELDKSIVKGNKKLKAKNKALEKSIKDQKNQL